MQDKEILGDLGLERGRDSVEKVFLNAPLLT
jgi:hypothetical protein